MAALLLGNIRTSDFGVSGSGAIGFGIFGFEVPGFGASNAQAASAVADRAYHEVLVGGADAVSPEEPLPMLVAIHGLGDRPEAFARLFADFPVPARLILPRGPIPWGEDGHSWFSLKGAAADSAEFASAVAGAASHVAELVREIRRTTPSKGAPVVTGFSQGGMISFVLPVVEPGLFHAAVPISGLLPVEQSLPARLSGDSVRWRALHGEADSRVPFRRAERSIKRLVDAGAAATMSEYPGVGHGIPLTMRSELYDVLRTLLEEAGARAAAEASPGAEFLWRPGAAGSRE